MGDSTAPGMPPAATQTSVTVLATRTIYNFTAGASWLNHRLAHHRRLRQNRVYVSVEFDFLFQVLSLVAREQRNVEAVDERDAHVVRRLVDDEGQRGGAGGRGSDVSSPGE